VVHHTRLEVVAVAIIARDIIKVNIVRREERAPGDMPMTTTMIWRNMKVLLVEVAGSEEDPWVRGEEVEVGEEVRWTTDEVSISTKGLRVLLLHLITMQNGVAEVGGSVEDP